MRLMPLITVEASAVLALMALPSSPKSAMPLSAFMPRARLVRFSRSLSTWLKKFLRSLSSGIMADMRAASFNPPWLRCEKS